MKGQPFSTRRQFSGFPVPATAKQLESLDLVRQAGSTRTSWLPTTPRTRMPAPVSRSTPRKARGRLQRSHPRPRPHPGEDHRIHRAGDRLIDDAVPDTRRSNVLARPMSSSGNRLGAAPK